MKKRWLGILLTICMVLTLLPTAAWAEGETEPVTKVVSTAEELTAAVNVGGNIKLTASIKIDGMLTIERPVTLDLNNYELKATEIVIKSEFTATGGTIDVRVDNTSAGGVIKGGTFSGSVKNSNKILGGTFRGTVENLGLLPVAGQVQRLNGQIIGGDFYGEVTNGSVYDGGKFPGTITGGNFYKKVTNTGYGMITGGSFYGEVVSDADKVFRNDTPYGCITGGTFYGGLTDNSTSEDSVQTWTVTYYDVISAKPCAKQVVQNYGTASAPTFTDGRTVSGWYTDEACTEEYDFSSSVTNNITLYAKLLLSYNLTITDASGEVYNVTSENAKDVLSDGTVVYTPGYIDAEKTFATADWEKALRGETVEGIRLPKLTLNGANLRQIDMKGAYGSDSSMLLLSTMLQLELVGDNKINCSGNNCYAVGVHQLIISGEGSLSVTATGETSKAVAIGWDGGYRQNGGTVTLSDSAYGIYSGAKFEFTAGKLTVSSSKYALHCGEDEFRVSDPTTTFYCGGSEKTKFELKAPFDQKNISDQVVDAVKKGKLQESEYGPIILYAQLTSNYTVTFDTDGGSAIDAQKVAYGGKATAPEAPTRSGYTFDGWYLGNTKYDFNTTVTKNITLTAHWTRNSSGGGGGTTTYTLTFDTNGGSALSALRLARGSTVDLARYVPERSGHVFTGWYADAALTQPIETVTLSASTTVYAGWRAETNDLPFTDVGADAWYRDDVQYVYDKGLMTGTTADRFAPNGSMTRAMLVTVLWRQAGSPVVNYAMDFSDVAEGAWYAEAVRWAAAEGVVGGYGDGRFGPDDPITREQLATILFRHLVGDGAAELADWLRPYADADQIGSYAVPAMQWAVGHGVLKGDGDQLDPQGTATRAQVAAVLHRALTL